MENEPKTSQQPGFHEILDNDRRSSVRHAVAFSRRRFDVKTLQEDMRRVYYQLEREFGEHYALVWVFSMRTAVELHRAWHMTLLTSKILQQIKDKFGMRMTWNLGVLRLIFRVEDGRYELQRKVPYDYDSEFQDLYAKIAVALVEDHIDVHQALIFQSETKQGIHTAKSGLFLRRYPGRLVLYPLEAATCAVIFFSGDWADAGVAAICGLVAGLIEWGIGVIGGEAKALLDVAVGTSNGIIAGLFFRFQADTYCISSIFLGTLYWFFYGTAFVIGILEIIAGELQTGVTRFVAVSIKTFVLSLGAAFGLFITLQVPREAWFAQAENCGRIDLGAVWWRIPLYLLCSASALGQYRFPIVNYWRGLVVQLAGYEVQYQLFAFFSRQMTFSSDFLDTAIANVLGAMAAVAAAEGLAYIVDEMMSYYHARLLQRDTGKFTVFGQAVYKITAFFIRAGNWIGLGRKSDVIFLNMEKDLRTQSNELKSPDHPRTEIKLEEEKENVLLEAIVSAEKINVWSMLMPAVYQLVPGSIIARLWFNTIFPVPLGEEPVLIPGTNLTVTRYFINQNESNVFENLMVISTSLALGLLIGFAVVKLWVKCFYLTFRSCHEDKSDEGRRQRFREKIMTDAPEEDPDWPANTDDPPENDKNKDDSFVEE